MPAEPLPREKWQPDNATQTCMVCQVERFSMVCLDCLLKTINESIVRYSFKQRASLYYFVFGIYSFSSTGAITVDAVEELSALPAPPRHQW